MREEDGVDVELERPVVPRVDSRSEKVTPDLNKSAWRAVNRAVHCLCDARARGGAKSVVADAGDERHVGENS